MDEINKQLQNVYIKQELLKEKGGGRRLKVFKPRGDYRSEFREITEKINMKQSQSSLKWTARSSFQGEKEFQEQ